MRSLLVALAIAGCSRAPSATTPANKAPAPDYRATADDMLGFLPVNSEIVLGVDAVAMRGSALWQKFEPQFVQMLGDRLDKFRAACGFDPMKTIERITMAGNSLGGDRFSGVVVVRGVDTSRVLDCYSAEVQKLGAKVTKDRGVLVVTEADGSKMMMAVTVVGPSTLIIQQDTTTSYDTMAKVLAGGAPLRTSTSFMSLFERRERGASVWGMANGNAKMFADLAQMGMRPKSVDGTLTVSDRFTMAVRLAMASPGEATRVVSEIDKVKGPLGPMVERIDARANAANVAIDLVITEAQLRTILGMMGGMLGGP